MSSLPASAEAGPLPPDDFAALLNALPRAYLVVDGQDRVVYANHAAEQFLQTSHTALFGKPLMTLLPADSPLFGLIHQVRQEGHSVSEQDLSLETPKIGAHVVSVDISGLPDESESVVLALRPRTIARKISNQLTHRNAARSVTAMAAMLAHEVKNPLSGIRGAAQLLELNASAEDQDLTKLICDEADRIVGLVNRMEMFSDDRPLERAPVNIHEVLGHVRQLAQTGFARSVTFLERYDPSLPLVDGNRDQLIQVFLNLVKNAAEAVPDQGGEIVLSTRFQQGVRLALPGSNQRVDLPLEVTVQDNGPGIAEDLRDHLFDPFVTTKISGKGLGLALVAKIIGDHGGVIEAEGEARRTLFRVSLPMSREPRLGVAMHEGEGG